MIILASKSPRRRELLGLITKDFIVKTADADEALPLGIEPERAVAYLSQIKAQPFKNSGCTVIGADTVVSIDGKILGKPKDRDDACNMIKTLSGRTHSVFTGVTLLASDRQRTFCVETKVSFYELEEEEITAYIDTPEPYDKAGAYGIQGAGGLFVEGIEGDYYNVVGLPVGRLKRELGLFSDI